MPRDGVRLGLSFAGSLALNGLFLFPGMVVLFSSSPSQAIGSAAAHNSQLQETPPDDLDLGIDESDASTLTWIGYQDYMEHIARRAEFEQAQLRASLGERASGSTLPVPPTTTPAPPAPDSAPVQVQPDSATPSQDTAPQATEPPATPAEKAAQETGLPADPTAPDTLPTPADETPAAPAPGVEPPSDAQTPAGETSDASPLTPKETNTQPTPDSPTQPPASPSSPAAPAVTPSPQPTDATTEPDPDAPAGRKGVDDAPLRLDGSDRDADATSLIKVTRRDLNLGKPQAREGMKLYPRKPEFTSLRVVSSGGNRGVLARLVFKTTSRKRGGRLLPAEAYIGREVRTGKLKGTVQWFNKASMMGPLEQSIHSSLFSWAADGKKIDAITEDNPVIVNLDLQIAVK
jgi:hypothetical protein